MVDDEISNITMLTVFKEWHRDVRYHPICSRVNINSMTVAVEAATQGVTSGEDRVSRQLYADDFVGISETPERLKNQLRRHYRIIR